MRRLITYFIILLLAIWLGLKIAVDPGYVFITYHKTSIEMTFWFFLLIVALIFGLTYLLLRFVFTSHILPKKLQTWLHNRREQKAVHLTEIGLCKFIDGQWQQAERSTIKASKLSPIPLINFLLGAYSAHRMQHYWKRDHYLSRANKASKNAPFTTSLFQVKLQIEAGQFEQALATLKHLHKQKPKHQLILDLLKNIYLQLEDFHALAELLPKLKRYRILESEEFTRLEQVVYTALSQDKSNIEKLWNKLPKNLRTHPQIVINYTNHLIDEQQSNQAERILADAISKNWQPELIDSYSNIASDNPIKQLSRAEKWLKSHTDDPYLLLCLGRLCKQQTLWGKAQKYLTQSNSLLPRRETLYELGQVMEAQNNTRAAMEYYRHGVEEDIE